MRIDIVCDAILVIDLLFLQDLDLNDITQFHYIRSIFQTNH